MHNSFHLEWAELPEELREQKITEVLEYWKANGDNDPAMTEEDYEKAANECCKSHFPIYF